MSKEFNKKDITGNWILIKVLRSTIYRLNPMKQLNSPVLFIFYTGSVILTVIFLILWLRHGFDITAFKAMVTAWGIVLLTNLCEVIFETLEDNDKNN